MPNDSFTRENLLSFGQLLPVPSCIQKPLCLGFRCNELLLFCRRYVRQSLIKTGSSAPLVPAAMRSNGVNNYLICQFRVLTHSATGCPSCCLTQSARKQESNTTGTRRKRQHTTGLPLRHVFAWSVSATCFLLNSGEFKLVDRRLHTHVLRLESRDYFILTYSYLHKFIVEVQPRVLQPPARDLFDAILAAWRRATARRVVPPRHTPHMVHDSIQVVHHASLPATRLKSNRKRHDNSGRKGRSAGLPEGNVISFKSLKVEKLPWVHHKQLNPAG